MSEHRLLQQTAEEYFKEEGVSATLLDYMAISAAHGKAYIEGKIKKKTRAMQLGTLAHTAIFQPDLLTEEHVHFQPDHIWLDEERARKLSSVEFIHDEQGRQQHRSSMVKVKWNDRLTECKYWVKEHSDKEIVSAEEWDIAVQVRDNAHKDATVKALLSGGYPEQSLFVEDEQGTVRKSRFDYFATSGNHIPDLKTCVSAHPDDFEKAIYDRSYFIRAAFYIDNANLAGMSKDAFVFICVETSPPYVVACYRLDEFALEAGRALYRRNLQLYRNCMESGKWPGYHEGIKEIGLPHWVARQLEEVL